MSPRSRTVAFGVVGAAAGYFYGGETDEKIGYAVLGVSAAMAGPLVVRWLRNVVPLPPRVAKSVASRVRRLDAALLPWESALLHLLLACVCVGAGIATAILVLRYAPTGAAWVFGDRTARAEREEARALYECYREAQTVERSSTLFRLCLEARGVKLI